MLCHSNSNSISYVSWPIQFKFTLRSQIINSEFCPVLSSTTCLQLPVNYFQPLATILIIISAQILNG